MWCGIAGLLPEHRAVLPDLPGHGHSRHIAFETMEQAADVLAGTISEREFDQTVDIVGLSLGGYVGLRLIERHPHLVRRAMLSGFHICGMPNARMIRLVSNLTSPLMSIGWFRRKAAASLGMRDDSLMTDANGQPNATARTIRAVSGAAVGFDAGSALGEIETPTLAVAGGREHPVILKSLAELQQRMPHCVARIAPGLGHGWCAENPHLFADTVRSWIAGDRLPDELDTVT